MNENIYNQRYENGKPKVRKYHQAKWDEEFIFNQSVAGQRGILLPQLEKEMIRQEQDVHQLIPSSMRRSAPPALPEVSQGLVVRHFTRLSQQTLGPDVDIEIGQGTCTMKYNPKINEQLARLPQISELHPLQPEDTVQGILEIFYRLEQLLKEISGLDRFTFQPGAGSQGILTNATIIRAYHASRRDSQRDEIITTIFSHPSNPAAAKTAGFKVVTLYPDPESGYPTVEALKSVVSKRTAGLLITNPEDTGIFNPHITEMVDIVHEAGGLCVYDQANANGILGKVRARDNGFDMCHFNLHKTFGTPHGSGGPGTGASGVTSELAKFLPVPTVEFDNEQYYLDYDRPQSIGKIRSFLGVSSVVLKAYAWIMNLGAQGLQEVAETAVLNNNYLMSKMLKIHGISAPYSKGNHRIEQVRYSWKQLAEETGVHTEDFMNRAADFALQYYTSHHPFIVEEPVTLEPTEGVSTADLDEYASTMAHMAEEAYTNPELVKTAPHNSSVHQIQTEALNDPDKWAMTWRAYKRKHEKLK